MKKRLKTAVLAVLMATTLAACSVDRRPHMASTSLAEVPNHEDLFYDTDTKIVYFMHGEWDAAYDIGFGYMSAYYAPNGLPYQYDITTNTLVEIGG